MNTIPHATVTTPGGEELVLVPRAAFEAMQAKIEDHLDAAAHAESMAAVGRGEQELLSAEEVRAALLEATPLAFWRKKRGLTQTALAAEVGIKQGFLSEVEAGKKMGDPSLYRRLAKALRVRMEDLVPEEVDPSDFDIDATSFSWDIVKGLSFIANTPHGRAQLTIPRAQFDDEWHIKSGQVDWARANPDKVSAYLVRRG